MSESGHVEVLSHQYDPITRAGGSKFWFHGFRNCFITVVERELMLPRSLTKRLVNHARGSCRYAPSPRLARAPTKCAMAFAGKLDE